MKVVRNVRISTRALLTNRLRALLGVVGITMGVAAVIIMVAIGEGARREVIRELDAFGTNLLVVKAGKSQVFPGRDKQSGAVTTLSLDDAEAIRKECDSVESVVPVHDQGKTLKYGSLSTQTTVVGTVVDYLPVRKYRLSMGRFFTEEENRASMRVAVLGAKVQESLFESADPIGEIVRVDNVPFEVIGVFEAKGVSPDGADQDSQIVIPLRTALRRVFQQDHIEFAYVQVRSKEQLEASAVQVTGLLRERHRLNRRGKPDDFLIQNLTHIRQAEVAAAESLTTMIAGVAAVSLFVGGVGILSIMLLTARERTGEIGLRMATGARRRDILAQFLIEAQILGLLGGLVGVGCGLGGAAAIERWTRWTTAVPPEMIGLTLAFSISVGLIFGVYPARRASLMDPIEALRSA